MKKVLLLAYFYPPSGGAGVQRTVKFVKYLSEFGYMPIVIAGMGVNYSFLDDHELSEEVSDFERYDIQFSESEKLFDNYLRGPIGRWTNTSLLGWLKAAGRIAEAVIEKERPEVFYVSTSPFPAAKVAAEVARKFRVPWVLDMRDPWALDPVTYYPTKLHYHFAIKNMKKACQQASAVIMNTPGALNAAINAFKDINPDKFFCITNGWDRHDFPTAAGQNKHNSNGKLKIIFTGTFLTRGALKYQQGCNPLRFIRYAISPINLLSRTPHYLFAACQLLISRNLIKPTDIKFIFAGDATKEDKELALKYQFDNMVEFRGYISHKQSINLLYEGDVLFLPLHELGDGNTPLIVPGKTYEYLASNKPILAALPQGDARDYVMKSGLGYVCDPSNIHQISQTILTLLKQHKSPEGIKVQPNNAFINQFERRHLTQNLASVFDAILRSF